MVKMSACHVVRSGFKSHHVRKKLRMNTNLKGNIGESKALTYFISQGYEVYIPFGTATKCDMIVTKDNKVYRVSVKSTSTKTKSLKGYKVGIRQGKLKSTTVFNKEDSDILFIYIIPEDLYFIFNTQDVTHKNEISINLDKLKL